MSLLHYANQEKEEWKETALEQTRENNRLKGDLKFYKAMNWILALCCVLLILIVVMFNG